MLLPLFIRQRAILDRRHAGRQRERGDCRVAFQDLLHDRLARGLRLGAQTVDRRDAQAAKAAIEALRGPQDSVPIMLAEYRKRRDFVVQRLRSIPGVKIAEPRGAFYAYPNVSVGFRNGITSALQFSEKLLSEAHVAVVPGEAFGTTEHVRISYATSMKELERGLDRIARFITER
jgi:aspartate aminotransferase